MAPRRSAQALSGFLAAQGHRRCKSVKAVVPDGSAPCKTATQARLGRARRVLDRFADPYRTGPIPHFSDTADTFSARHHQILDRRQAGRPSNGRIDRANTHKKIHVAAAIDAAGRLLGTAEFAAHAHGCASLLGWISSHGRVARVGVEGTGSHGSGLARRLATADVDVVEVNRPNRQTRRRRGKTDAVNAEAAARAALSGHAAAVPKSADGPVEAIRTLSAARRPAVKARTRAADQTAGLRRHRAPPPQPRRQPPGQQRPMAHRRHQAARRPAHHRLRPTPTRSTLPRPRSHPHSCS